MMTTLTRSPFPGISVVLLDQLHAAPSSFHPCSVHVGEVSLHCWAGRGGRQVDGEAGSFIIFLPLPLQPQAVFSVMMPHLHYL